MNWYFRPLYGLRCWWSVPCTVTLWWYGMLWRMFPMAGRLSKMLGTSHRRRQHILFLRHNRTARLSSSLTYCSSIQCTMLFRSWVQTHIWEMLLLDETNCKNDTLFRCRRWGMLGQWGTQQDYTTAHSLISIHILLSCMLFLKFNTMPTSYNSRSAWYRIEIGIGLYARSAWSLD